MENNKEKKWYILNVVSGQENKIANEINLLIATNKYFTDIELSDFPKLVQENKI